MDIITDADYKEMWDELKDRVDIPDIDKDVFYFYGLEYLFVPSEESEMRLKYNYSDMWKILKIEAIEYSEECMMNDTLGSDALSDVIDCMYEIEDKRGLFHAGDPSNWTPDKRERYECFYRACNKDD